MIELEDIEFMESSYESIPHFSHIRISSDPQLPIRLAARPTGRLAARLTGRSIGRPSGVKRR
jgi:hypothetical protein